MHQENACARVVENICVLVRSQEGVSGNGDRADLDNAEEAGQKVRTVREQENNPLLQPNTKLAKRIASPVGSIEQLLIAYLLITALNGNLASPAFEDVTIHEKGCGTERLRQSDQE